MIVVYLLLIIFLFPILYWYYIYFVKFRDFRKLPGPKPFPVVGNWFPLNGIGIVKRMQELYTEHKPRYVFYTGFTPRVFHSKPEHIQYILSSTVHINKSNVFQVLEYYIGDNLLVSNGGKWRQRRKTINHAFSMNHMKEFLKTFNKVDDILLKVLESNARKGPVDILEITNFSTLDTTLETLMGVCLNTQENRIHSYVNNTKEYLRIIGARMFSPFLRNESLFLMFSKQKDEYLRLVENLKNFTRNIIKKKMLTQNTKDDTNDETNEYGIKKKYSLMDLLLSELNNNKMDYEDVRGEIDTFVAAGHETSAGLLTFILYELSHNLNIQTRVYEEIMSIAPSGNFTMEQLAQMTFLEMVIKESLRLHSVVPYVERQVVDEFELDGIRYPVGCVFGIPISCLHVDPKYFPDPYKFDPLRFSPENVIKIPTYAFLPFSAGPRICIGYRYAMLSSKCAIAKCIREYEFTAAQGFNLEVEFQLTLKPVAGAYCQIRKRNEVKS